MPDNNTNEDIPPGFKLRHTLRGHSSWISRISWSPEGKMLASPSRDLATGAGRAGRCAIPGTLERGQHDPMPILHWT